MERNVNSLKRTFSGLYRDPIPTGDPHIPAGVQRAKHIRAEMAERIYLSDGEDAVEIADRRLLSIIASKQKLQRQML